MQQNKYSSGQKDYWWALNIHVTTAVGWQWSDVNTAKGQSNNYTEEEERWIATTTKLVTQVVARKVTSQNWD